MSGLNQLPPDLSSAPTVPSHVITPDAFVPVPETQSSFASAASTSLPPLVVDLDGTLVKTDLLLESLFSLLRQKPLCLFALPFWLLKGRAHLKREIASRVQLDVASLPYRTALLEKLGIEHGKGRSDR